MEKDQINSTFVPEWLRPQKVEEKSTFNFKTGSNSVLANAQNNITPSTSSSTTQIATSDISASSAIKNYININENNNILTTGDQQSPPKLNRSKSSPHMEHANSGSPSLSSNHNHSTSHPHHHAKTFSPLISSEKTHIALPTSFDYNSSKNFITPKPINFPQTFTPTTANNSIGSSISEVDEINIQSSSSPNNITSNNTIIQQSQQQSSNKYKGHSNSNSNIGGHNNKPQLVSFKSQPNLNSIDPSIVNSLNSKPYNSGNLNNYYPNMSGYYRGYNNNNNINNQNNQNNNSNVYNNGNNNLYHSSNSISNNSLNNSTNSIYSNNSNMIINSSGGIGYSFNHIVNNHNHHNHHNNHHNSSYHDFDPLTSSSSSSFSTLSSSSSSNFSTLSSSTSSIFVNNSSSQQQQQQQQQSETFNQFSLNDYNQQQQHYNIHHNNNIHNIPEETSTNFEEDSQFPPLQNTINKSMKLGRSTSPTLSINIPPVVSTSLISSSSPSSMNGSVGSLNQSTPPTTPNSSSNVPNTPTLASLISPPSNTVNSINSGGIDGKSPISSSTSTSSGSLNQQSSTSQTPDPEKEKAKGLVQLILKSNRTSSPISSGSTQQSSTSPSQTPLLSQINQMKKSTGTGIGAQQKTLKTPPSMQNRADLFRKTFSEPSLPGIPNKDDMVPPSRKGLTDPSRKVKIPNPDKLLGREKFFEKLQSEGNNPTKITTTTTMKSSTATKTTTISTNKESIEISSTSSTCTLKSITTTTPITTVINNQQQTLNSTTSSPSIDKDINNDYDDHINSEGTEEEDLEEHEERFLRELGWVPAEEDPVSDSEIEEIALKMKSIQNNQNNNQNNENFQKCK